MQIPGTRSLGPTRGQKLARAVLSLGLLGLGIYTLQGFLPALAWAAIFAIAIWPLYCRARHRFPPGRHNILLPLLFTTGVALLFIVPMAVAGVQVGREAHGVLRWVHELQRDGLPQPDWLQKLPANIRPTVAHWWDENLASPESLSDLLGHFTGPDLVIYTRHVGSQLVHRLVLFGFTLLTLFFLFRSGESLSGQMVRASQRVFGPRGERVGRQMVASVHGTVDGLVLVALGEGVLLGIAYAIAGVPHAPLFGAATAIAAVIPFGAPIAYGAAALLLLANGAVAAAAAIFVLGTLTLFAADHFIRPALIGGATRLPFIWVLLGILGGVEIWGLLGLFLGPAIMAALILLWRELADEG